MKLFVPFDISKADDAERIVEGYASTEALDSQGEIVTRKAMESALPDWLKFGNIREMHQPSAVGVAMTAEHDDKGLKLCAKIVDPLAWEKVKEGVYKGFSIGGRVTNRDKINKSIITGIHLTEISLVDRPANPEALFDVWKADGITPEGTGMNKGMMAVQMLANIVDQVSRLATKSKIEEDKENDTDSTVPASLQDAMNQLGSILQDMVEEETAELAEGGAAPNDPYCDSFYLNATNVDVEKKDYSEAERKDMTSDGRAMADGSFPIANKDDLENAIKAIGSAKDKEAAMAHIRKRAEDLGLADMIPDTWKTDEPIDLEKKGKRNSSSDQKKLNDAHDAIVAAGAQCDAAKHEATADLSKAQDDLAQSAIEIAKLNTQLVTEQTTTAELTKARDDATAALEELNKAHATIVTERDDLSKQVETLITEKAAQAEELDALKKEVEELKARPEPMKGKLLSVGKGDDITANAATKSAAAQAVTAPQEKWFSARPQ